MQLLTLEYKVNEGTAKAAADAVWNSSKNNRDCVKIGRMAKSIEDINFIRVLFMRRFMTLTN